MFNVHDHRVVIRSVLAIKTEEGSLEPWSPATSPLSKFVRVSLGSLSLAGPFTGGQRVIGKVLARDGTLWVARENLETTRTSTINPGVLVMG